MPNRLWDSDIRCLTRALSSCASVNDLIKCNSLSLAHFTRHSFLSLIHDTCDASHVMFGLQRTHPPLSYHVTIPDVPIISIPRPRISKNGNAVWLLFPTNAQNGILQARVHPSRLSGSSSMVSHSGSVLIIACFCLIRHISCSIDTSSSSSRSFICRSRIIVSVFSECIVCSLSSFVLM